VTAPPPESDPPTFAWDASALHHVGKAARLDVLGSFVSGPADAQWRHLVTDVVADELGRYGLTVPQWITIVEPVEFDDILSFGRWADILTDGIHDLGEASITAWAHPRHFTIIVDDRRARAVIEENGGLVHGSLWLLCESIKAGLVDLSTASSYADEVLAAGAYWPFKRYGFVKWARSEGLLPDEPTG
jgi:predicted nucleic acid-binding protein